MQPLPFLFVNEAQLHELPYSMPGRNDDPKFELQSRKLRAEVKQRHWNTGEPVCRVFGAKSILLHHVKANKMEI